MRRIVYSTLRFTERNGEREVEQTPHFGVGFIYREPQGLREMLEDLQRKKRGVDIDGNVVTIYWQKSNYRVSRFLAKHGSWPANLI